MELRSCAVEPDLPITDGKAIGGYLLTLHAAFLDCNQTVRDLNVWLGKIK